MSDERLVPETAIDEFAVQQFVMRRFAEAGLVTDFPPIAGVNANASDPHYAPAPIGSASVRRGDLLLLDLWAKLDDPRCGLLRHHLDGLLRRRSAPADARGVRRRDRRRDEGIRTVQEAVAAGRTLRGFEVDDAVRGYIEARGFGEFFGHRTGHSIGREVHGVGANMDNFETHDQRPIIPGTCFSIEPGIYLLEFGIRSEVDVFVEKHVASVTGDIQTNLVLL